MPLSLPFSEQIPVPSEVPLAEYEITPNDSASLARPTHGLRCGSAGGSVRLICADGTEVTIEMPPYGERILAVSKVFATGTDVPSLQGVVLR